MIFTFYSYKGGVGRSLALAHVAYALAERGLRVLAIDFDLEAPGLERYCFAGRDTVKTAREHLGLVDLIKDYRRALTSTEAFEARTFRDWKQYIKTVRDPVNAQGGRLDLMTAGRRGSLEQLRDYSLTVRTFDWLDFFNNWRGDAFFRWLRDEWTHAEVGYDVVLVDSRTGVTEMGGVCAYQLADVAVLLCAPNEQNLDGTMDVMRDFQSPGVLGLRSGRPLKLLAVPTRLEEHHAMRGEFLERFSDVLGPPALGPGVSVTYDDLALPYLPPFAISEPVVGEPANKVSDSDGKALEKLTASMRKLADALTLLADPTSPLGRQSSDAVAALGGEQRPGTVPLRADTSRRSAGYDFFIDYGIEDAQPADELARLLRDRNQEVFIDFGQIQAGTSWSAEIERALDYSACVLVCFGKASVSAWRTNLLKRARNSSRPVILIPILLPGGSESAPHSFGLEDQLTLDLRQGMDAASVEPLLSTATRSSGQPARLDSSGFANPYRGTLPYIEHDARFLFGRDEEIRRVVSLLEGASVLLIDGAAKVGKTSLLRAGVIPLLRADKSRLPPDVRVHDASRGDEWPRWRKPVAKRKKSEPIGPDELIVIDQWDDLGALPSEIDLVQRRSALKHVLEGAGGLRKAIVVARDVESVLASTVELPSDWRRFTVAKLEGLAWRSALTEPAKLAGHLLENGLAERVTEGAGLSRAAILQAQLALAAMWDLRQDGWLTNRSLDALGHVPGIFKQHLDVSLSALDDAERQAATVLFQALCRTEQKDGLPLAISLPWSTARTPATVQAVGAERLRDRLAAHGLIDVWTQTDASLATLQVALTRADVRSYFDPATWEAAQDFMLWRSRISSAMSHWVADGSLPTGLLTDSLLTEASRWYQMRRDALTSDELEFVEASLDGLRLRSESPDQLGLVKSHDRGADLPPDQDPLRVSVLNCDIRFVSGTLMVGHYRSLRLTGTEAMLDRQLDQALSKRLAAGMYPDQAGSSSVFVNVAIDRNNPLAMARPSAVVVVGLGDEGRLRSADLILSIRQAVLNFSDRRRPEETDNFEISTTLVGSGSTGVSTASSAQLIAQGVLEANQQLRAHGKPVVEHLQFVELFHDRACDAWRALRHQSVGMPGATTLGLGVSFGPGALRRALDSGYRGVAYDILSATTSTSSEKTTIDFRVDTVRARTETRAQVQQPELIRELVSRASNEVAPDAQLGKALFNMLVPNELIAHFGGTQALVLELDAGTATLPWELIDTVAGGADPASRPWAIRTRLVRKLRTTDVRTSAPEAFESSALVVGDPLGHYPPLPGARAEAEAVARLLSDQSVGFGQERVRVLTGDSANAASVIHALFERAYRIVHVAGHGLPGTDSGLLLSSGTVLGAREIAQSRSIPELVFVDTAHLPALSGAVESLLAYDRVAFAAKLAEELLRIGVQCVVCAGLPVEDAPAIGFATAFYHSLMRGQTFGEAVGAAREAAWGMNPRGVTWAAYQCYGDVDWTLRTARHDGDAVRPNVAAKYADIASPVDLTLALESIAVQSAHEGARSPASLERAQHLESRFGAVWGQMGAVAESFGVAYGESGDWTTAIVWYQRALAASDGSASLRAAEQLGSLLARRGFARSDAVQGRAEIQFAIAHLDRLVAMQSTPEREILLATAYKRLAIRCERKSAEGTAATRKTILHFGNAERALLDASSSKLAYAGKNAIAAELRLAWLERRTPRLDPARVAAIQASLSAASSESPDFWSLVASIEFAILLACAARRLTRDRTSLLRNFDQMHDRIASPAMWGSVYDEAVYTLEPYAKSATTSAERAAATSLLERLGGYAQH